MFLLILFAFVCAPFFLQAEQDQVVRLEKDFFSNFRLEFDQNQLNQKPVQSYAHYQHNELQDNVINTFTLRKKINEVGQDIITQIINDAFCKEIELADTHYVFYHGCRLDFLLYQDLLKFLAEIMVNARLGDSFLLRIPSKTYDEYNSAQHFLKSLNYDINDKRNPARKYLLSVNPSLFGNSVHRETSSAFCYFLESKTAFKINLLKLVKQIFKHFKIEHLYEKYKGALQELHEILEDDLLGKTGILMQIFIPKCMTDDIVYRSLPRGIPYYSRFNYFAYSPEMVLENYQKNTKYIKRCSGQLLDNMQFRLVMNNKYLLNLANGRLDTPIIMHRYWNQTPQIKKYYEKFELLKNNLCWDL